MMPVSFRKFRSNVSFQEMQQYHYFDMFNVSHVGLRHPTKEIWSCHRKPQNSITTATSSPQGSTPPEKGADLEARKRIPKKSYIILYMGKFDHDLTVLPHWKSWFILGKSFPNGPTIQVSELLKIHPDH